MTVNTPLLVTFAGILLLIAGIGFRAWLPARNSDTRIPGSRSPGRFVAALSTGASDLSGWLPAGHDEPGRHASFAAPRTSLPNSVADCRAANQ